MQQQHLHQPSAADSSSQHTLEQQLLQQWDSVVPTFDALFVNHLPTAEELFTSLSPSVPEITVLANQSAIAAIPAALNQATSALLRMMLAAAQTQQSGQPAADATLKDSCSISNAAGRADSSASGTPGDNTCTSAGNNAASAETAQQLSHTAAAAGEVLACGHKRADNTATLSCCSFSATSQPLPLIPGEAFFKLSKELGILGFTLCASIALSLLAASFAPFLVRCGRCHCCKL
jgi:hypothetical protein